MLRTSSPGIFSPILPFHLKSRVLAHLHIISAHMHEHEEESRRTDTPTLQLAFKPLCELSYFNIVNHLFPLNYQETNKVSISP